MRKRSSTHFSLPSSLYEPAFRVSQNHLCWFRYRKVSSSVIVHGRINLTDCQVHSVLIESSSDETSSEAATSGKGEMESVDSLTQNVNVRRDVTHMTRPCSLG